LFDSRIRQRDKDILSENHIFIMLVHTNGIYYHNITDIVRKILKENERLRLRVKEKFTLLTAKEMAKELRFTEQHLRNLISKKKLKKGYHYGKFGSKVLFIREKMYEFANLRVLDSENKSEVI